MSAAKLPPLPPSDEQSLMNNRYDGNYRTRARSFWGDNEIIHINNTPTKACEHKFTGVPGGVKCSKCHFGLLGAGLEIRNGQVHIQGEPIRFSENGGSTR
jgi:hypothetical protein